MNILTIQNQFLYDWNKLREKSLRNELTNFLSKWWELSTNPKLPEIEIFVEKWCQFEQKKQEEIKIAAKQKHSRLKEILFENDFLMQFWKRRNSVQQQKRATTPDVNIFKILRIGPTEIRHSNFLSWLFDKEETHLHKTKFLEIFLSCAEPISKNNNILLDLIKPELMEVYDVRREYQDMDISLVFKNAYVVIENKIRHTLQEHQPQKYEQIAISECQKLNIPTNRIFFILLSINEDNIEYINNISLHSYKINYKKFFQTLSSNLSFLESPSLAKLLKQYIETLSQNFKK